MLRRDPFEIGEIVAGKYRVERVIGEGAMGIVLAATHLELDDMVAIKFIRPEVQEVPGVVGRFGREARASARLKSEHVARVFDVGMEPGRGPYIVMEYLVGRDLNEVLRHEGPLPMRRAVDYVLQACEALALAHANGITHRDIKPENLFLTQQGDMDVLKVLDFGISKVELTDAKLGGDLTLVGTTSFLGTLLYMSPEQIRGTPADPRTDIWSIGAVLYELLTKRTAFWGENVVQVCAVVLEGAPAPLRDHCPNAPAELQAILDRCFEKDAEKRFQNVAELAASLLPFAPSWAQRHAERTSSILRQAGIEVAAPARSSSVPPPSSTVPVSISSAPRTSTLSSARVPPASSFAPTAKTTFRRPRPRSMRSSWIGGLVLLCGAVLFAARRSDRTASASGAPAIATAEVVALAPLRAVLFESDPTDALVEIGGQPVGRTPLHADVETGQRVVQFSREGFESQTVPFRVNPAPENAQPARLLVVLSKTSPSSVPAEAHDGPAAPPRQGTSRSSAKTAAAVPEAAPGDDLRSPEFRLGDAAVRHRRSSIYGDTTGAPTQPVTPTAVMPAAITTTVVPATEKRVKLVDDQPSVQLLQ